MFGYWLLTGLFYLGLFCDGLVVLLGWVCVYRSWVLFVVCFDVCELIWMFSFYGFGLGLCIDLWALWLMVFCCFGGFFDLGCDTGLVVWWICLFLLFLFYWVFAWFLCFVILFCFSWFEFRLVV